MSTHPLIPAKPATITLDTLPDLFAHHRARFGGWTMTQTPPEPEPNDDPPAPERPDDIPEDTWNALGDPGKQALAREREARQTAERALAVARAKPAPPKPKAGPAPKPNDPPKPKDDAPDFAALIQQAVEAAVKPFTDREEQRATEAAADKVRQTVLDAAKPRLHDATDALSNIDLVGVVNEQGQADPDKLKTALDDLVTRKPHLAKTPVRTAPVGIGGGGPANQTDGEKVKAVLADMQKATGVRPPAANTN